MTAGSVLQRPVQAFVIPPGCPADIRSGFSFDFLPLASLAQWAQPLTQF